MGLRRHFQKRRKEGWFIIEYSMQLLSSLGFDINLKLGGNFLRLSG
jgi:hypothetical protein